MTCRARPIIGFLVPLSFVLCPSSIARAHQGAVRLCERAGDYQLAVFTLPTPFRAGPVDVTVLVQDAATGECVTPARVTLHLTARGSGLVLEYPATSGAASNRLFHEAVFELPEAGWWDVEVSVDGPHGPARARFEVEAGAAPPPRAGPGRRRGQELWPWFGWRAVAVALFGLHRVLAGRRRRPKQGEARDRPVREPQDGPAVGNYSYQPVAQLPRRRPCNCLGSLFRLPFRRNPPPNDRGTVVALPHPESLAFRSIEGAIP